MANPADPGPAPLRMAHSGLRQAACCLLVALMGMFYRNSHAVEAVRAPQYISERIPAAQLVGEGLFRWFGFRVYTARLWAGNRRIDTKTPTRRPIALQLIYARHLKGAAIANRSTEEIRRLAIADEKTLAQWNALMARTFPDVAKGDSLTGITDVDGNTFFYLNGMPLSAVRDPAFSRAFFSIWLHRKTSAPELRNKLLNNGDKGQ